MFCKVYHPVGVAPLIVVPADKFNKLFTKTDSCLRVEDAAEFIMNEILTNYLILSIPENSLQLIFTSMFQLCTNLFVSGRLIESDSQIYNGDIGSGNAEGDACEFVVELGNDQTDGLRGPGGGGDDIEQGRTTCPPVFALPFGPVDRHLGGGHCVHSGHQSLLDPPFVVDHICQRGQTVCSAARVGHYVLVTSVLQVVHTVHVSRRYLVSSRSRHYHLLCSRHQMGLAFLLSQKRPAALQYYTHASATPRDVCRVFLVKYLYILSLVYFILLSYILLYLIKFYTHTYLYF